MRLPWAYPLPSDPPTNLLDQSKIDESHPEPDYRAPSSALPVKPPATAEKPVDAVEFVKQWFINLKNSQSYITVRKTLANSMHPKTAGMSLNNQIIILRYANRREAIKAYLSIKRKGMVIEPENVKSQHGIVLNGKSLVSVVVQRGGNTIRVLLERHDDEFKIYGIQ